MATLSFEYLPPATSEARQNALRPMARLAGRCPDFVLVTYGPVRHHAQPRLTHWSRSEPEGFLGASNR